MGNTETPFCLGKSCTLRFLNSSAGMLVFRLLVSSRIIILLSGRICRIRLQNNHTEELPK